MGEDRRVQQMATNRPFPAPATSMPPPIVLPKINPAHLFELLVEKSARIEELERQRDAVLALHQPMPHDPTRCGICHQADQSCGCCGSWDENDRWPCKTVEIYGGGQ